MVVINRRDDLPFAKHPCGDPKGEGMELNPFLGFDGVLVFQVNVLVENGLGFSPFGETGEGFLLRAIIE